MGLKDREKNRRNSVVISIIGSGYSNEGTNGVNNEVHVNLENGNVEANGVKAEKDKYVSPLKARSYYLTENLYKAVGLKAALTGADKSAVVRAALTEYLKDVLQQ